MNELKVQQNYFNVNLFAISFYPVYHSISNILQWLFSICGAERSAKNHSRPKLYLLQDMMQVSEKGSGCLMVHQHNKGM